MPAPQEVVPGCPPGLEYLTQVDQLLVNQMIEAFESECSNFKSSPWGNVLLFLAIEAKRFPHSWATCF